MPPRKIMDRLAAGETLLLDGGTGSELQRRGVDVLKGATERLEAWSATANIEFADVVRQVHQDYLRVGADILTSNNFWTVPSRLETIGLRDKWRDYARAAGENALRARRAGNPEAYVAGGIAAPTLASEDVSTSLSAPRPSAPVRTAAPAIPATAAPGTGTYFTSWETPQTNGASSAPRAWRVRIAMT